MANRWKNSLSILMELNIIYFFLVLIYMDGGILPSIPGVLLAYASTIATFIYLASRLSTTYVSIMLVAPVIAIVPYLFSYNLVVSLLIGLFLSFRGFMYFIEERPISTFAILMHSFFWMSVIYVGGVAVDYPFSNVLLGLFALQLVFVLVLYSGETFFALSGNRPIQKRVLITTTGVFAAIVATALFFSTVGKWVIAGAFSFFGSAIAFITGLIATPIMYLLGLHDWKPKANQTVGDNTVIFEGEEEGIPEAILEQGNSNPFLASILILVFVVILYMLLKRTKVKKDEEIETNEVSFASKMTRKSEKFGFSRENQKPPEDQVRRLMFDLEKLMAKKKRGRLSYETLEDWLKKETFLNQEFMQLYAKVRYGDIKLSPEEIAQCKVMTQELRKTLKELQRVE
ncbi:hypothetical protein [Sutcliffiella halmapala]|uniref:hypothetical protein n=1 Tax=Sutcliffiella halmapala TaxID=79882 RepID=UPI000995154A|nr:hypothetical protein [Sutcliffiella halmapala]